MRKPSLIPNWRRAWRMFSVQAMVGAQAVLGGWAAMPDDLKAHVKVEWAIAVAAVLLVLGIAGRLVDQPKVKP